MRLHTQRSWAAYATQACLWLNALNIWQGVGADNITNPMHRFHSRPDLVAPIVTSELYQPELLTPGYIFLAPYQAEQEGVYIYDNEGNLVWSGFGASGPGSAHAPYVCNYKDTPHICYFQGVQMLGYGWGHGIIMDSNYRFVRSVEAATHQAASDEHEFKVLPDGKTALLTIYERKQYDLSTFGLNKGLGFIQSGLFQEVDIETGKPVFEWDSLDHIPPSESFVLPGTTEISGDGYTRESPWDYFHINSVDKNEAGDYLISARHVSGVYKISGKDGSVMWRLGGVSSDFAQDFHFSSQHDARFLSSNDTHDVISIFDNASNGFNVTKDFSEGIIITMDLNKKIANATQYLRAPDPNGGMGARSQGNVQVLDSGNAIVGWGNNAFWTEYAPDGTAIWHAWIAMTGTMIYRVQKFNWTGTPHTLPALYTYSQNSQDTVFYMSWNGATEVKQWRLYTSNASIPSPSASTIPSTTDLPTSFTLATTIPKSGFETAHRLDSFSSYSYIEALDANSNVLSRSKPQRTFIPSPALYSFCNDYFCSETSPPTEEEKLAEEERHRQEEEILREKDEELQESIRARRIRLLVFDIIGSMIVIAGVVCYCGGKGLRRKAWVWGQDVWKVSGEMGEGVGRKWRGWNWKYDHYAYRRVGSLTPSLGSSESAMGRNSVSGSASGQSPY